MKSENSRHERLDLPIKTRFFNLHNKELPSYYWLMELQGLEELREELFWNVRTIVFVEICCE